MFKKLIILSVFVILSSLNLNSSNVKYEDANIRVPNKTHTVFVDRNSKKSNVNLLSIIKGCGKATYDFTKKAYKISSPVLIPAAKFVIKNSFRISAGLTAAYYLTPLLVPFAAKAAATAAVWYTGSALSYYPTQIFVGGAGYMYVGGAAFTLGSYAPEVISSAYSATKTVITKSAPVIKKAASVALKTVKKAAKGLFSWFSKSSTAVAA